MVLFCFKCKCTWRIYHFKKDFGSCMTCIKRFCILTLWVQVDWILHTLSPAPCPISYAESLIYRSIYMRAFLCGCSARICRVNQKLYSETSEQYLPADQSVRTWGVPQSRSIFNWEAGENLYYSVVVQFKQGSWRKIWADTVELDPNIIEYYMPLESSQ